MFGDVSRLTFKKENHHSGVFIQQGRPLTDADWGEQVKIYLHAIRTVSKDLIGPHGGPRHDCGFKIITDPEACRAMHKGGSGTVSLDPRSFNFGIGKGRYYVDGYLCENDSNVLFSEQDDRPLESQHVINLEANAHLIYLDVWERHIGENEAPHLRDPALPVETSFRSKTVWQVKAIEIEQFNDERCVQPPWDGDQENSLIQRWQPHDRGLLRVMARTRDDDDRDPCAISHASKYRGLENQIYRIQVHRGGPLGKATFKFSRDNGSVVFGIKEAGDNTFWLNNLGKDDRLSLSIGDLVELVHDDIVLQNRTEPLLQVVDVDQSAQKIVVEGGSKASSYDHMLSKHPFIRRWDHKSGGTAAKNLEVVDGALKIVEGQDGKNWLHLEDGISIQFVPGAKSRIYRAGDYWVTAARVATGDVEWPKDQDGCPIAIPPHGVEHHYAPLGLLSVLDGKVTVFDWRKAFEPLAIGMRRFNDNIK